jgi:hypothetical protein
MSIRQGYHAALGPTVCRRAVDICKAFLNISPPPWRGRIEERGIF